MEKSVNKNTAGVSIIEILVSMVLVAIALVAITTVFPSMNKNRKGMHEADQAKMLATQVLEGLQFYSGDDDFCGNIGDDPSSCVNSADVDFSAFCGAFKDPQAINSATYKITWKCDPGSDFNTAAVSVAWYDRGGKKHDIKVTGALR